MLCLSNHELWLMYVGKQYSVVNWGYSSYWNKPAHEKMSNTDQNKKSTQSLQRFVLFLIDCLLRTRCGQRARTDEVWPLISLCQHKGAILLCCILLRIAECPIIISNLLDIEGTTAGRTDVRGSVKGSYFEFVLCICSSILTLLLNSLSDWTERTSTTGCDQGGFLEGRDNTAVSPVWGSHWTYLKDWRHRNDCHCHPSRETRWLQRHAASCYGSF